VKSTGDRRGSTPADVRRRAHRVARRLVFTFARASLRPARAPVDLALDLEPAGAGPQVDLLLDLRATAPHVDILLELPEIPRRRARARGDQDEDLH